MTAQLAKQRSTDSLLRPLLALNAFGYEYTMRIADDPCIHLPGRAYAFWLYVLAAALERDGVARTHKLCLPGGCKRTSNLTVGDFKRL
jgi:hypothetical protein